MRRLAAILITAAMLVTTFAAGAGTATAASKASYYLSLGDSLAAGEKDQYPDQLFKSVRGDFKQLRLVKMGCGGETTLGMIVGDVGCAPGIYPEGSQLAQAVAFLNAHAGEVAFITIDIGANDILGLYGCIDFDTFVLDGTCVTTNLPTVDGRIATIVQALEAAAPDVPIYAMTYYDPLLGMWYFGYPTVAVSDNTAVDQMNDGFSATYQANGVVVADVWGAFESENWDVIQTDPWGTVPTNVARACDWTRFCTSADIHPNIAGYGVIAQAFVETMA
jgi:lysophospholipase L1-like esterase